MQKVLTAAQMREVDRLTTERYGIPSIILMENAAHAVARVITEKLGGSVKGKRILILCGKGNNGGDGAALARILWTQGSDCFVYLAGPVAETTGDARCNFDALMAISESDDANWPNSNCLYLTEMNAESADEYIAEWTERPLDCFVDALFGTGLSRPVEGGYRKFIDTLSRSRRSIASELIVSVDMPSGLISDRAESDAKCVLPDVTVTFTAPKTTNILPPTHNLSGELVVANIGSPEGLIEQQESQLFLAEPRDIRFWLKKSRFSVDSYKNKRGHALVLAGSETYSGAAVLSANSAMRSGVGLVTLACPAEAKTEIAGRLLPEVILATIGSTDLDKLSSKANAIAIGPGLSATDPSIETLVKGLISERTRPTIVDAGALSFLNPPEGIPQVDGVPLILTPHEGEFMRLLGSDDKSDIEDRVAAVRKFSQENNVILVLKGERVLIGEPGGKVVVNPTGNSGLGKAGNGDTLTGILAGLVAQAAAMKIDIFDTVVAAVYVAGFAGDIAEKKYSKRVMTASDVRECLTDAFNQLNIA